MLAGRGSRLRDPLGTAGGVAAMATGGAGWEEPLGWKSGCGAQLWEHSCVGHEMAGMAHLAIAASFCSA